MAKEVGSLLDGCLYFTSNALTRAITRMAEKAFAPVAMTPSHAFLLMLAIDRPGITQKELAAKLHLAPSTVSRFVDALVRRDFLEKETAGRNTFIHPTQKGCEMLEPIQACWQNLHDRYVVVLGDAASDHLNDHVRDSARKLEKNPG